MPHLARIRLVSVGYRDARMEDLTLDFTDNAGRPVDSTIWLRNGGGKSSILNLFFAILRPGRHEFLGARSEAGQRRLEHYVSPQTPAVVVCEWELDNENGTMLNEPMRHLTGVFYENTSGGSGEDSRLRRLFFAGPVSVEDPRLTLQGLPLFVDDAASKRKRRRTLASFRQEWTDLRTTYPQLHIYQVLDIQREWTDYLEGLGIDPEVFKYQIQMNMHEGDAQKIFQFKTSEDFADFLLEMVVDPERHAAQVAQNIEAFQEHLHRRQELLLPEQELTQGLIERLAPVVEVSNERRELCRQTAAEVHDLRALAAYLRERIEQNRVEQEQLRQIIIDEHRAAESCESCANSQRRECAALRLHIARREHDEAAARQAEIKDQLAEADRRQNLWRAAVPLRDALRMENEAREYRITIQRRSEQHAPLQEALANAAHEYAGALFWQIEIQCQTERHHAGQRVKADQRKEERRRSAEASMREAALDEKELEHLEMWLRETRQEQERLISQGVLQPAESGREGIERITREQATAEAKLAKLTEELQLNENKVSCLLKEHSEARVRVTQVEQTLKLAEQALHEMLTQKETIEQISIVCELLEADHFDLAQLSDEALGDLNQRAHEFVDRLIAVNVEKAEDQRSEAYLEKRGLLPPSPDVERVLMHLKARLRSVWSGWEYLAENIKDEEQRSGWIASFPHLAAGVIVRREDFEKACEIIKQDPPRVAMPVSVTSVDAFLAMPGIVRDPLFITVTPQGDALYDKKAGHQALIEIQRRLADMDDEITSLQQRRRELEDALHKLHDYRERYPRHWQRVHEDDIQRKSDDLEQLRQSQNQLGEQIEQQTSDRKELERDLETVRGTIAMLARHLDQLEFFHRMYEAQIPALQADAEVRRQSAQSHRDLAAAAQKDAEAFEIEAVAARGEERTASEHALKLGFELKNIDYLERQPAEGNTGDIQMLGDQYRRLKGQYERAIDEGGLLLLAEQAETKAREHRDLFQAKVTGQSFTGDDVLHALQSLASKSLAAEELEKAERAWGSLFGQHGNASQVLYRAEIRLTEVKKKYEMVGELPELPDAIQAMDIPQIEAQARKLEQSIEEAEAEARRHKEKAGIAEPELRDCEIQTELLEKDRQRLDALTTNYEDLLQGTTETFTREIVWVAPEDSKQNSLRIERLEKALSGIRSKSAALNNRRDKHVQYIQTFTRGARFEELKGSVGKAFTEINGEDLEPEAERWLDHLALRLNTIQEELAQVETHRQILLKQLLEVAAEGLRILRHAAQRSELPQHVPRIGGAHFLRIHTNEPPEHSEQVGRMAELLDQFIDEGQIPSGIELVLTAVRRLARSIRVHILHPDPDHSRHTIEIPEMARFSGGEQLTSAVLLYCTLAQLRARQRGKSPDRSSVLLLDNPIGNASRVRFLQVQRDVARAMGVQLIYTTAVNDFEALSVFPNIIRLRNNRIDRNSGRRILEPDDTPMDLGGVIDGVRIGRSSQPAAASEEQAHGA